MVLQPADYVILAASLVSGVLGLFVGFSGALGFVAGLVGGALAVRIGYGMLESVIPEKWMCSLAALVLSLIAFGLARVLVKKTVHGLLAQPADAIFGLVTAVVTGGACALGAAFALDRWDLMDVDSELLRFAANLLGFTVPLSPGT